MPGAVRRNGVPLMYVACQNLPAACQEALMIDAASTSPDGRPSISGDRWGALR